MLERRAAEGRKISRPYDQDGDPVKEAAPRCRATARHPSHDGQYDNLGCELPYVHRGPHHSGQWVWEDTMADAILDRDGNELSEERGVEPGAEPKQAVDGGAVAESLRQQEAIHRGVSVVQHFAADVASMADPEILALERVHDALAMLDSQSARARVVSWAMGKFELSFGG